MALRIREAEGERDRVRVRELLSRGFSRPAGLGTTYAALYDRLCADHSAGRTRSLIAERDGRLAGHVLVLSRQFCFHESRVPGATITMLVVDPDYRGEGVGSRLLSAAEDAAAEDGAALVQLSGDPAYYGPRGYVEGYRRSECEMPVDRVREDPRVTCRPLTPADIPVLSELAELAAPAGSAAPTRDRFGWLLSSGWPFGLLSAQTGILGFRATRDLRLVVKQGEATLGYLMAAGGEGALTVYEAAVKDSGDAERLLSAAARAGREIGCARMCLRLPEGHSLAFAADGPGCTSVSGVDRQLLAKVLDPVRLMTCLLPLLSRRLADSDRAAWCGSIDLDVDGRVIRIRVSDGGLACRAEPGEGEADWRLSLPGIGLTRAVLGTEGMAQLAPSVLGDQPAVRDLLNVVFPALSPHFWLADTV